MKAIGVLLMTNFFDNLFDNVGVKIQKIQKIFFWIILSITFITGFALFIIALNEIEKLWWLALLAPIIIVVGVISAWLSVIFMYAFGQLVDDVHTLRIKSEMNNNSCLNEEPEHNKSFFEKEANEIYCETENEKENEVEEFECLKCKKTILVNKNQNIVTCPWCNTKFKVC